VTKGYGKPLGQYFLAVKVHTLWRGYFRRVHTQIPRRAIKGNEILHLFYMSATTAIREHVSLGMALVKDVPHGCGSAALGNSAFLHIRLPGA